jgi:hypothetical protein
MRSRIAPFYVISKFGFQLWRDDSGQWHYDGPASSGPRAVRYGGRGPYWRGTVTPQFAGVLLRKIRESQAAQLRSFGVA